MGAPPPPLRNFVSQPGTHLSNASTSQSFGSGRASHLPDSAVSFILKTHSIVNDDATDDIIRWNSKGNAFVVLDSRRLENEVCAHARVRVWFHSVRTMQCSVSCFACSCDLVPHLVRCSTIISKPRAWRPS